MRRSDRARGREFSLALIDRCTHGVMALSTGEAAPYCLPLSFVRTGDELYFHCAREGRKIDLMRRFPRVCVTFVGEDRPAFESAIVTGTAGEVNDPGEKIEALRALCRKVTPEHMAGFEAAIEKSLDVTAVWKVHIEEITGKEKPEK